MELFNRNAGSTSLQQAVESRSNRVKEGQCHIMALRKSTVQGSSSSGSGLSSSVPLAQRMEKLNSNARSGRLQQQALESRSSLATPGQSHNITLRNSAVVGSASDDSGLSCVPLAKRLEMLKRNAGSASLPQRLDSRSSFRTPGQGHNMTLRNSTVIGSSSDDSGLSSVPLAIRLEMIQDGRPTGRVENPEHPTTVKNGNNVSFVVCSCLGWGP